MKKIDVSEDQELNLISRIEALTEGKVVLIERQPRWRPSWFVDVKKGNNLLKLYVRGDRESDVVPFPELKREADILSVLKDQGIPAPKIYGMCTNPDAIIMEAVAGTRDVAEADSPEQAQDIARQYMQALADMHRLPLKPFENIGVKVPEGAEEIALVGLEAYLPLYLKQKTTPDPLITFAMQWLRTNVPMHRNKASFIAFDAGQFLFENGKITTLYDFEFAMIGDPLTDLATMAMRQSVEPMGEEIGVLCDYYAQITGEAVDKKVVRYHHALFATVACMQFSGAIKNPQSGDPHDIYVEWDLALRRSLLFVLADCFDVALTKPASLAAPKPQNAAALSMLADMLGRLKTDEDEPEGAYSATSRLVDYLSRLDQYGEQLGRLAMKDAEVFIGLSPNVDAMNEQLEVFVQQASSELDGALLQFFSNQIERQLMAVSDIGIGFSASHVRLEPL